MGYDLQTINIPASRTLYFNSKIMTKVALIIDTPDKNFELQISKNITHPSDCHPEPKDFETLRNFDHPQNFESEEKKYILQCFDSGGYAPMKLDINITEAITFYNIGEIFKNNKKFQLEKIFTTEEEFKNINILTNEPGDIKDRVTNVVNTISLEHPKARFKFIVLKQTSRDNVLVFNNSEFKHCLGKENVCVKILPNNGGLFKDVNDIQIPLDTKLKISDDETIYKMKKIPKTESCYSSIFLDFDAKNNINITEGNLRDARIHDYPLNFIKLKNLNSIDDPVSIRERKYYRTGYNSRRIGVKKKLTKKRKSKKSKKIYKKKKTNKKKKTYKKKKKN